MGNSLGNKTLKKALSTYQTKVCPVKDFFREGWRMTLCSRDYTDSKKDCQDFSLDVKVLLIFLIVSQSVESVITLIATNQ